MQGKGVGCSGLDLGSFFYEFLKGWKCAACREIGPKSAGATAPSPAISTAQCSRYLVLYNNYNPLIPCPLH